MSLYRALVYLHIIGAMVWVGGILFLGFVAVPATRGMDTLQRGQLLDALGRRFRGLGYTVLALLVVTGAWQATFRGATWANVLDGSFFTTRFGQTLALKLIFFTVMVIVSSVHDFYIGPRSADALAMGSSSEGLRKAASWLARVTAVLALVVVYYAMRLVR